MGPRRARAACAALALLAAASAAGEEAPTARAGAVDAARIGAADTEPGQWLAHGRTWDEQRHSPLVGITRDNVGRLGLAWSYTTGTRRGLEATPIVVDGVMYATGSWSVVFALDARTGRELWRHDPQVPRAHGRFVCCDVVNRGAAVWKGRVYVGTIDGRLIALDAASGELVWSVQTTDPDQPYSITGAPRVVKDKVVIGNSGGEYGVRGYFSAYDAATGELAWRFFVVPRSKDGPHEHPELEIAARTWSKDSLWEAGLGGTVWNSMAYDPALDLLYVGTGNSSVYDQDKRSPGGGDNLFLASILAVRPDSGRLVWHYQTTPGERWDYTSTEHIVLADLELDGKTRKVLMQAPKNGFFYVLDRATGELLSAESYVPVSWASHVDLASGRPVPRDAAVWSDKPAIVTPGVRGGHNWHPMSWSPRTGLMYVPTIHTVHPFEANPDFAFVKGRWNTGENWDALSEGGEDYMGAVQMCAPTQLTAWDPVRQQARWRIGRETQMPSGLLSTASDLLFLGDGKDELEARDARTGEKLWSSRIGTAIIAPPVTYELDGEQYVAVLAGTGGAAGLGFAQIDYVNEGHVLAYKLGGTAALPEVVALPQREPDVPELRADAATLARGRTLYSERCLVCHGLGAKSSGILPDLRLSPREVHEGWDEIVLGGTRAHAGMASFADALSAEDSHAIHAYVISRALRKPTLGERLARFAGRFACVPVGWIAD